MSYKTYQLKIKNTDEQYFNQLFCEHKWYYNTILASSDIFKFDTKCKTAYLTPEIYKDVSLLSSQMRQEVRKRLISSIVGLSKLKKKGHKVGRLKFRGFSNSVNLTNQTFKIDKERSKVKFQGYKKSFKVSGLNQLPENFYIQSGILHRNSLGLYLLVTVKDDASDTLATVNNIIGVDFGIKNALTFSDGTVFNPEFGLQIKKVKSAHKSLSHKVKDSNNYVKAKVKLGKEYQKLTNQKNDLTNKVINKLKPYTVYFQDELISLWKSKKRKISGKRGKQIRKSFGKKIQNNILGRFKSKLKLNSNNHMLESSEPTTKLCPNCKNLNSVLLSERVYECSCGYSQNRDIHSARNMILIGSGRAYVEKISDLFDQFSKLNCENKHFSVKQEACNLNCK